jgi:diguanylate cyclase (GGDEF)-like protein
MSQGKATLSGCTPKRSMCMNTDGACDCTSISNWRHTCCASHVTRHTSHVTRHTSHVTNHTKKWKNTGILQPLSLLTVDIDAFKDYNEWYGPSLGDRCLTAVAQCLAKQMQRESDLATRYNGDAFAVVLPNIDMATAAKTAQHLCDAVAALAIPHASSSVADHVTVSVGVASGWAQEGVLPQVLTKVADSALQMAKGDGGNRVVVVPVPAQLGRGVVAV